MNTDLTTNPEGTTDATAAPFRVASVPYLNALPLHADLGMTVDCYHPTTLAQRLRLGLHDAALVPVAECLECDEYRIVDGAAVGSDGPVFSVILGLHTEFSAVNQVALDPASKTSAMLTRVLFANHYKKAVKFERVGYEGADAIMLIGDQAIEWRRKNNHKPIIDLGEAWQQHTRLPFVYAVWAIRRDLPLDRARQLADRIRKAARTGLSRRADIARTPEQHRYLTEHIFYEFGPRQKEGLAEFAQQAHGLDLIPTAPTFEFI